MQEPTSLGETKSYLLLATIVLTAALLAAALATRSIALLFPGCYGLHAALCAPIMAGSTLLALRRTHHGAPVVASLGIMALLLGAMRPLRMGFPFFVAALCARVATAAFSKRPHFAPIAVAESCSIGLYPATLAGGLLSHSLYLSDETILVAAFTATITTAACLLVIVLLTESR